MCVSPIILKRLRFRKDDYVTGKYPCGKCIECMQARRNSWHIRLLNELKVAQNAIFATFTYDDECITLTENNLMNLDYKDVQRMWKRYRTNYYRKHKENSKLKYFLVGEYGSNTHRPHYHAIIFNVDVEMLQNMWEYGFSHIGEVNEKSIFYTLKYCLKKTHEDQFRNEYDDRAPEKALMSKGLGISYLTKEMIKYHKNDITRGVTYLGNKKMALPRYYRDKIFTELEKEQRTQKIQEKFDKKADPKLDPLFNARLEKRNKQVLTNLKKTD